jgi:hypothetical protein
LLFSKRGHDTKNLHVKLIIDIIKIFWFNFSFFPAEIFSPEAIGNEATPGLLCQPRVIVKMIVEKQMDCRLAGETEVLGENLPQHHFCPSQNPT